MQSTPVSLLERLRQPENQGAWRRFVKLYTPLLYYWAKRTGFEQQEADDLVQEVFTHLVQEMPKFHYDGSRTFRGWLHTVAINKWNGIHRRRQVPAGSLNGVDVSDPRAADPQAALEARDTQQFLYRHALELMQSDFPGKTWKACYAMVVAGKSAPEVAEELQMTPGAVHAARYRVLARLRAELAGMVET
jgi:RNA polymerase sigma-70 factor, ECF subfamily